MTKAESLAGFVARVRFEDISAKAVDRLKHNILDSIGCAIKALDGPPIQAVRDQVREFSASGACTLVAGGSASPPLGAFHNAALIRYVDFMDNYMAKKQSGHPCDTMSSVLAASEYAQASGKDFMLSLALAYQVFCV